MIDELYLTLVGSVSSSPTNTLSRFITRLPEQLHLKKDRHQIGLVDLVYPRTMSNLPSGSTITIMNGTTPVLIEIPRGHYETIQDLITMFNRQAGKKLIEFAYDSTSHMVTVNFIQKTIKSVKFDKAFAYFLGFSNDVIEQTTTADHRVDIYNNQSIIYIYCDLCFPSITGNVMAPILQVCPISGNFGDMIRQNFNPVRYHDIMTEEVSTIEIQLLSEHGDPIDFSFGSVVLTLHIKVKN